MEELYESLKYFFMNMEEEQIISLLLFLMLLITIIRIFYIIVKKVVISNQIRELANNAREITPEDFFKMRNTSFGGRGRKKYALTKDFAGVYILYNKTRNMYYVGQSREIFNRVNSHFRGKGNGDVYADYKYGNEFTIRMIALRNTKFSSLNDLERNMIRHYSAFSKGYNKTRGNK